MAWKMYEENGVKFLPQALEEISEDRITDFIQNIEKSGLMKKEDIEKAVEIIVDEDSDSSQKNIQKKLGI
ncbi:hypothetical protein [Listeria cornellensis]|uniref:Uncharacterized protein n=1 Tax=Listeria cornellensis FSL F6-0969 TaxID=1265820 RepID=W7BYN5_9LIST|nr:hypothetical protein [Listeria cornellensis]EUJ32214.1 hypothetical protein PCORN_02526 [Listeria cornellensis FSL F6-0969]